MRTVPALAILNASAALAGEVIRPDLGNTFAPDADTLARFTARLNEHLPALWNGAAWPELVVVNKRRRVQSPLNWDETYPQGAEVWDADTNGSYRSVVTAALANKIGDVGQWAPLRAHYPSSRIVSGKQYSPGDVVYQTDPEILFYYSAEKQFVPLTPFDPAFPYDVDWDPPAMGDILRVTYLDPRVVEAPGDFPYELGPDGVRVGGDPGSAWFTYRRPCPLILGPPLDSASAYLPGDQIFWATGARGDYFDVLAETFPGETPTSHPAKFAAVQLPARFAQWLSAIVSADWLRWDGQTEKALDREAAALREWDRLLLNLNRDQRQSRQLNVQSDCYRP